MLPELNATQNVYIEITNPVHGGSGWEFGSCLWSPAKDKSGGKAWKIMEEVKPDDIILHLLKKQNRYYWVGVSKADSKLFEVNSEPPKPSRWADMLPYQRINIKQFTSLKKPIDVSKIFSDYDLQLRQILRSKNYGLFYVEYGNQRELRVSQRYFAKVPEELYNVFHDLSNKIDYNVKFGDINHIPTNNEPSYPDYSPPSRTEVYTSRIVRDSRLVRDLKEEFDWKCQICGKRISLPEGRYYCEGHHLKPLGSEYQGPDTRDNILILCPFHHAEFDYGTIAIDPNSKKILHADPSNEFHNKTLNYERNDVNVEFLKFHFKNIFWGESIK